MFYNKERKKQYLQECGYAKSTISKITTFFNKASVLESLFNKSISEFNIEELESLFYSFNCTTLASIRVIVAITRRYVLWEANNGYLPSKNIILDLPVFQGRNLEIFLNLNGERASYVKNRDELFQLVSELVNPRDKAIVCLLYEGVCGEGYCELRYLKKRDCDFSTNTILIMDKERNFVQRVIRPDDHVMAIVHETIHTNTYVKRNGTTDREYDRVDLVSSDYVIRTTKGDGLASRKLITLVFESMRKTEWCVDFYCQYLTPTSIRDSGLLNCVSDIEEQKAAVLTDAEFKEVLNYYGKRDNVLLQYRSKYNLFKTWKS